MEIGPTPLGRGVVAKRDIAAQEEVLSLSDAYTLVVADNAAEHLHDRDAAAWYSSYLERWQKVHGTLPEGLPEFFKTSAPWDARLAAWLEWVRKHGGTFWKGYASLLPAEENICTLGLFSEAERSFLQIEELKKVAETTRSSFDSIHFKYLAGGGNELRNLKISERLSDTLRGVAWVSASVWLHRVYMEP